MKQMRDDVNAALARSTVSKLGSARSELILLGRELFEGEQVREITSGNYGGAKGLVVLTDKRVIFLLATIARSRSEDFPLSRVASVAFDGGMLTGDLVVSSSGGDARISKVARPDGERLARAARELLLA